MCACSLCLNEKRLILLLLLLLQELLIVHKIVAVFEALIFVKKSTFGHNFSIFSGIQEKNWGKLGNSM